MMDSFEVCFKSATWDELKTTLDSICLPVERGRWHFPRDGECCACVYLHEDMLVDHHGDDYDRLCTMLGDLPANILCIELRGSQYSKRYCATNLVILLLRRFEGIVY